MPTPLLADLSSLPWVAIIAVMGGMLVGPFVVFLVFRTGQRNQELWHETARVALEKGQPMPAMPGGPEPVKQPYRPANDIRTGLIMIATGAGLFVCLNFLVGSWLAYVGAIPGFIGVALLLFGLLSQALQRKPAPPADHP